MSNSWSEETTLKFVQLYRTHENLWNIFISEYVNHDYRIASMEAIACELNLPNFLMKDVRRKINALRSTYYLELAKIEKSKASGEGTDSVCIQAFIAVVR
ncbi:MADF domain [Cinara cedri]|uniref:MADF domain n=1 Tax=Cinara cedri TaxID=506608 RepID=A0A5E4MG45_9HEMI|nr:MADF domain [Cinara cedri]